MSTWCLSLLNFLLPELVPLLLLLSRGALSNAGHELTDWRRPGPHGNKAF